MPTKPSNWATQKVAMRAKTPLDRYPSTGNGAHSGIVRAVGLRQDARERQHLLSQGQIELRKQRSRLVAIGQNENRGQ